MSLGDVHDLVTDAESLLEEDGCESIGVIGRSFGGQVALTCDLEFDWMVLWAPAVGFGEDNVESGISSELGHASKPTDISIDDKSLEMIGCEVKIILGTEDEVVGIENSRSIVENLTEANLVEIEGTDNSFKGREDKIVAETVEFIGRRRG